MVLLHGGPGAGSSYLKAFEAISDEQILVRAGVAADAGKAVLQHAAGEELLGDLRDDRTPRAVLAHETVVADRLPSVQVIRYQPQERRRLRASELVDAACRRGCVGHGAPGPRSAEHTPDSGEDRLCSVRDGLCRRNVRAVRA